MLPLLLLLSRFSHVQLFVTLWTVAHQAPLSLGFFRQEYWNGLPCPPPRDLLDPGIELTSASPVLAHGFVTTSATWEARTVGITILKEAGEDLSQLSIEGLCYLEALTPSVTVWRWALRGDEVK